MQGYTYIKRQRIFLHKAVGCRTSDHLLSKTIGIESRVGVSFRSVLTWKLI